MNFSTALPAPAWLALAGLTGACLGSFASVLIHRLPRDRDPWRGRSACPHCDRTIAWHDNLPLLSWLLLRGRCRSCRGPIAARYPALELAGLMLAVAIVALCGPTWRALAAFVFAYLLGVIAIIDWRHMIIPHTLTVAGMVLGIALAAPAGPGIISGLLGLVVGLGGVLALSHGYRLARGRAGMGGGDAMLMGMVGAFLGPGGAVGVFGGGALLGTVYALARDGGKVRGDTKLPFGTFLAAAAVVVFWVGAGLWSWYLGLLS